MKIENIIKNAKGEFVEVVPQKEEAINVDALIAEREALGHEIVENDRVIEKYQDLNAVKQARIDEINAVIDKGVELQVESVMDAVAVKEVEAVSKLEVVVDEII